MQLKELQSEVDQWINTHGVRYFNELTNLAILMEEVGEFSRLTSRVYGEQSFKKPEDVNNVKDKLADEAADILFVLTCLCNQMGIDMQEAMNKNLLKKTKRDKNRHKSNSKLKKD